MTYLYASYRYLFLIFKLCTLQYICSEPFTCALFFQNFFLQWLLRVLDDLIAVERNTHEYINYMN